ncbi:MAG: hypothetical protein HY215_05450 [Candidatus Rokubacteria bacterium]|nr:hypothetical protein [Candidatus Rokubacteria bacterium]
MQGWRRALLWGMLAAKLWGGWGLTWDIRWHLLIGRDSFWIPPHLLIYSAVVVVLALCLATLARETLLALHGGPAPGSVRRFGLLGTPGTHLACWGLVVTLLAAPIDDLWHRLFGLDVTLWSPPHLLGLTGSQINSAGCLLLAVEAYPPDHSARRFALLLGGAIFFGTFHLLLRTSLLWAYEQGGLAFFYYPLLGALLLPVALVPVARLSASRWAPAVVVALAVVIDLVGGGIARAGFDFLKPTPAIEEALAREPASPIATFHRIAKENGTPAVTYTGNARAIMLAFLPALALCLVDARRRAVLATLAFAAAYFALVSWHLAQLPAFRSRLPAAPEIAVGIALVLIAGALGGIIGRWLGSALARPPAYGIIGAAHD